MTANLPIVNFVCPKCKSKFTLKTTQYYCRSCGYNAKNRDGIVYFHPEYKDETEDYPSDGLDRLFKYENVHFWFKYRKHIIVDLVNKFVSKNARIIDIGSGTGNTAVILSSEGYKNIAVGEIYQKGLEYAKKQGITKLYQFDVTKSPFHNYFDVICMFDVLEHLNDDITLRNIKQMLKSDGIFIATVPAHQWLWSNLDTIAGHKKRYELIDLKKLFKKYGIIMLFAKHIFVLILPLLLARSVLNKKKAKYTSESKKGLKVSPIINTILLTLCFLERFLLQFVNPPVGGSIIVVGKKL